MECIKYSEDMHKMREAFAENKRFECLDRKTANVIRYKNPPLIKGVPYGITHYRTCI